MNIQYQLYKPTADRKYIQEDSLTLLRSMPFSYLRALPVCMIIPDLRAALCKTERERERPVD